MSDPEALAIRSQTISQLARAARAFARGEDGMSLVPPELRSRVEGWRGTGIAPALDLETWLLGLLTLACLAGRSCVEAGAGSAAEAELP